MYDYLIYLIVCIHINSYKQRTPFMIACERNNKLVVDYLLNNVGLDLDFGLNFRKNEVCHLHYYFPF